MNISVSAMDVAREIARDGDFSFDVLSEVAYYLNDSEGYKSFAKSILHRTLEEEDYGLIDLILEISKQFEKIKEDKNEIPDPDPFAE